MESRPVHSSELEIEGVTNYCLRIDQERCSPRDIYMAAVEVVLHTPRKLCIFLDVAVSLREYQYLCASSKKR